MTFTIKPSVNIEAKPSDVANGLDGQLPDCTIATTLSLTTVSGLTLRVGTGNCVIKGHYVQVTATEDIAITDNSTRYVLIQLLRNANSEVTSAQVIQQASSTATDAYAIGRITTSAGAITIIQDIQLVKDSDGVVVFRQVASMTDGTAISASISGVVAKMGLLAGDSQNAKLAARIWANGNWRELILWG